MPDNPRADLDKALIRLDELAADSLRDRVAELRRRLSDDKLRVLVVGEAKRGKSTFVNALLGEPVLPMGVTPLTSLATTVTYGRSRRVEVVHRDGSRARHPLEALPDLVSEIGNPGNRRGLVAATVYIDIPLLAEGIELVDTPGTGSVHADNTAEAQAALKAMDAAIFILTADPAISARERTLLSRIAPSSVATFVVLNKTDRHTPDELAEVAAFTADVVQSAAGRAIAIHLCSARQALTRARPDDHGAPQSSMPGIDEFRQSFRQYLHANRSDDLLTSIRRQAHALTTQLLDELHLTLRADSLRGSGTADSVGLFRTAIDKLRRQQLDAADLAHGETGRLLADINTAADSAVTTVTGRCIKDLDHRLATRAANTPGSAIEQDAPTFAEQTIKEQVENWRTTHAHGLQHDLEALDDRLRHNLLRDTNELRQTAADLLHIDLHIAPEETVLATSPRFHYVSPAGSWTGTGGLRRHLPGPRGRRGAERLHDQVRNLVPKHLGRARGDLQQRLQDTTRQLVAALSIRYDDYTTRLLAALDAAAHLQALAAADSATLRGQLTAQRESLEGLADNLAPPTPAADQH